MRKQALFLLLGLQFAATVYGLPCATTGADTKRGDSIEEVLHRCGQPYAQKFYTKSDVDLEKWIYFKSSPAFTNTAKISIVFNAGHVANIEINNTNNVMTSDVCGALIQSGHSMQQVINACGEPSHTETLTSTTIEVREMRYSNISPKIWVFENGVLVDWLN